MLLKIDTRHPHTEAYPGSSWAGPGPRLGDLLWWGVTCAGEEHGCWARQPGSSQGSVACWPGDLEQVTYPSVPPFPY